MDKELVDKAATGSTYDAVGEMAEFMTHDTKHETEHGAKRDIMDHAAHLSQALPDPSAHTVGALPEKSMVHADEERIIMEVTQRLSEENRIRVHYYVKIAVSVFLCALLLSFGIPVFMASRMTGSLSYTALGVVLIGFAFILMASVIFLLFRPPKSLGGKK